MHFFKNIFTFAILRNCCMCIVRGRLKFKLNHRTLSQTCYKLTKNRCLLHDDKYIYIHVWYMYINTHTWSGLGSWTFFFTTLSNNWSWSRFSCSHSTDFPCSQICARILQNNGSTSYNSFMFSVLSFFTEPSMRTCLVCGKLSVVFPNHKKTIEAWGFSAYTNKYVIYE